ncbi:nucleotide exchange factor GrpE [Planctomycetota bacterium]
MSEEEKVVPSDDEQAVSTEDGIVENAIEEFLADDAVAASTDMSEVGKLKAAAKEANDRALRAQAEVDNVRRRFRRENEEAMLYANKPLLTDLLPVIDNIHRALESARANPEGSGLLEGVSMVAEQLIGVLEKNNCPMIQAKGEQFDPDLHAAILQQASDEPKGTIIEVAQDGYRLHERLIRPSQVIVSTGPAE